jgi:hypothetical protein
MSFVITLFGFLNQFLVRSKAHYFTGGKFKQIDLKNDITTEYRTIQHDFHNFFIC